MSGNGIVIGLDPSFTSTGVAAVNLAGELVAHGVVAAPPKSSGLELVPRALRAALEVRQLVGAWTLELGPVRLVAVEGLVNSPHAGHTNGVIGALTRTELLALWPITEVPAAVVKRTATGRGNAPKTEVAVEAFARLGAVLTEDEADAAWLAVVGLYVLGHELPGLPKKHRPAVSSCSPVYGWPER